MTYNRPETLRAAFQGCDTLFLLGPSLSNQTQCELNAVEAAQAVGVGHIVKQSVMAANEEAYSLAKVHRLVEIAIESSRLTWTFLRPNSFMQNISTFMGETISAEAVFYSAREAKSSGVTLQVLQWPVKALTDPSHQEKSYTLTGPQALTYDELANELTKGAWAHD